MKPSDLRLSGATFRCATLCAASTLRLLQEPAGPAKRPERHSTRDAEGEEDNRGIKLVVASKQGSCEILLLVMPLVIVLFSISVSASVDAFAVGCFNDDDDGDDDSHMSSNIAQ